MKTGIRTNLVQSVNLTPQLLQQIRLLQLNAQQMELELQQTLARNPLGRIPTLLLPDGGALYDSVVICEYLDGLRPSGPGLFPPEPGPARIEALRRHALGSGFCEMLLLWRGERTRARAAWESAAKLDPKRAAEVAERLKKLVSE